METADFYTEVYRLIRQVPSGSVITYGQIARLLGKPRHSRLVGQALHAAPARSGLPCHRVVNSQGRLAPGWVDQRKKLQEEGVTFRKNGCVDLSVHLWEPLKLLGSKP